MAIHWRCDVHETLTSTQDAVRAALNAGADEGLAVHAITQTAGRGRRGNQWVSPAGNLYFSVLLRPHCAPAIAGQMAFVVAVAVAAAIDDFAGPLGGRLTLKWPNDVLVDGVKCAGILLESDLGPGGAVDGLIIGMGVNVNAPPADRVGIASLVTSELNGELDVNAVRDRILHHLAVQYDQWQKHGFTPIRTAWMARAHGLNTAITARLQNGDVPGIFQGIDDAGALILTTPDGQTQAIHAGEVYFAQNA